MKAPLDRRAALERMKWTATVLVLAVPAGYVLARTLERSYPGLSMFAAFCEAAMVGAMADWFAVVALFRHPLGIPVPHTAIIPRSKNRIAENLGAFITGNFLGTDTIVERIAAFDPAARLANWLSQRDSAQRLGGYALRTVAYGLEAIEDQRVQRFIHATLAARLEKLDFARLGGELLDVMTQNGRHQQLLDGLIRQLTVLLDDAATQEKIAGMVAKEFAAWRMALLNFVNVDEMIGTFSAKKLVSAVTRLLQEVDEDPEHPLRRKFDQLVTEFIARLRTDPDFRIKGEQLRAQVLSHPELAEYLRGLWLQLRGWLSNDLASPDSVIARQIAGATLVLGEKLRADREMQAWLNGQIIAAARPLVEENRDAIGKFIADQLKTWDERHLVNELELNIGRDLQYIRINGTLVGGMIGLLIYGVTQLITG